MKFGWFMSYSKGNDFIKIFYKNFENYWKLLQAFLCLQRIKAQPLLENEIFEAVYLY